MEQFTYFNSHSKLNVIIQKVFKNSPISTVVWFSQCISDFMVCVILYNLLYLYFCFDVNVSAVIFMKWRYIKALCMYVCMYVIQINKLQRQCMYKNKYERCGCHQSIACELMAPTRLQEH